MPEWRKAFEAEDSDFGGGAPGASHLGTGGMLSPELAAGLRRVKGVKQLGCPAGNWLNREQAQSLLEKADGFGLRNVRDVAVASLEDNHENFSIICNFSVR